MEFFNQIGEWVLQLIETFSGWRPDPANRERLQIIAALLTTATGAFALYKTVKSILRFFGRSKALTPDEQVLVDAFADRMRRELTPEIEALKKQLAVREASAPEHGPEIPPLDQMDGLTKDLNAAIETLLNAGKSEALKDKTGVEAQAALDKLIAERSRARERVTQDEAALWRQKGALAFLHDTQEALNAYRKASELAPADPDGWNQLGHLLSRVGALDEAISAYQRVLSLGNDSADQATIAAATGNLGNVYATRGDLDAAEQMYRKALVLNEALGRKEGMANQYGNLGIVYATRGDLDAAEAMYRKSLALNEALGRKEGMASDYGNLGNVSLTRGDLDAAEAMYRKSLALNEALGRKEGTANAYGNLGNIYATRGDLDNAEAMYRKSLALNEALGRKEGMASDYANLGGLAHQRGDHASACASWTRARDLFRAMGSPNADLVEGWMREAGCES